MDLMDTEKLECWILWIRLFIINYIDNWEYEMIWNKIWGLRFDYDGADAPVDAFKQLDGY